MITKQQALQKMKADIRFRGLSEHTFRSYLTNVTAFLNYYQNRPVDELTEIDVRAFLAHLINEKKLTPGTVNIYSAAIRFFFAVTLNRTMNYLQIPRMKIPKKLPEILTRDEVFQLIDICQNLKHKAMFLLAYGSGLRVNELVSLRVKDIDSKSMRVFVRGGKGKKDRYTVLSENTLIALRNYWGKYRPGRNEAYLFPGIKNVGHLSPSAFVRAIDDAINKVGISKNVSPHTFRHCFATHLLEDGYNLFQIKEMLGHASLSSTTVYLHLANTTSGIVSPADKISRTFEGCPR